MKSAMFTITVKNGTSYCADNLSCYSGTDGKPAVAYICSGRLNTVLVEDVTKVELSDGWSHCSHCDQMVSHIGFYQGEPPITQA